MSAAAGAAPAASEPPTRCELALPVEAALRALEDAADVWGADWSRHGAGGRLALPVSAGIRQGTIEGTVAVDRLGDGSRLRFDVERSEYRLHVAALVVLLVGAAGALFTVLAPLFPPLLELLPIGGLVMLLAWFLVVARIRNRNAVDFFALVEKVAEAAADDSAGGDVDDG